MKGGRSRSRRIYQVFLWVFRLIVTKGGGGSRWPYGVTSVSLWGTPNLSGGGSGITLSCNSVTWSRDVTVGGARSLHWFSVHLLFVGLAGSCRHSQWKKTGTTKKPSWIIGGPWRSVKSLHNSLWKRNTPWYATSWPRETPGKGSRSAAGKGATRMASCTRAGARANNTAVLCWCPAFQVRKHTTWVVRSKTTTTTMAVIEKGGRAAWKIKVVCSDAPKMIKCLNT